MSTLCRFVLPSTLSSIEDACVAEFNEYKKRMKEITHHKSSSRRLGNATGGISLNSSHSHDSSHHHPKDSIKNPEQAKEAAKKLLQSGAIKVQAHSKDQGFKRAASSSGQERTTKKMNLTPNTPSTPNQTNPFQPVQFISASSTSKFVNSNSQESKRRVINYDDTDTY